MSNYKIVLTVLSCLLLIHPSTAIWCYRCNSAHPGCSDNFNWRGIGYWGEPCPEDNDLCVKITERKGANDFITRDCLSALIPYRTDVPADKYEGCRPGTYDPKLANYVNSSISEINVKRDYFSSTEWCFCFLDHRCNSGSYMKISTALLFMMPILLAKLFIEL